MNFNFVQVNEVYIDKVINKLKTNPVVVMITFLINISNMPEVFIKPLTLLINQCLHTGVYPSQLKMSRVKPLFKSGDKSLFNNYRPISLLPSLSKIFERAIFDQLLAYFTTTTYCA